MWLNFKYSKDTNRHRGHEDEPSNASAKVPHSDNFSSNPNIVWSSPLLQHYVKSRGMDWHNHANSLSRISLHRGIAFFIGQRDAKRKEMIDNLKNHTEDLIPELKKWAEEPLTSSKESLSLLAQQHIKDTELWEILEGSEGIRVLDSQCDSLANEFRKQIETSIKQQLAKELSKFEIENLNWFVEDIEEFIAKKLLKNKSHIFTVEQIPSVTPPKFLIRSERSDGSIYRSPYLTVTKENLEKLADIMNNILNDAQIQQRIKDQRNLGERLYKKRVSFTEKMNLIIDDVTHAVSDEDRILLGKCKRCEHIKKKLKIN